MNDGIDIALKSVICLLAAGLLLVVGIMLLPYLR